MKIEMEKNNFTSNEINEARPPYAARREKLRLLVRQKGLDALLVSHAANRFYLSGFELHDPQPNESAGYLVISATGPDWLATDSRYALAAEKVWNKDHIFIYGANSGQALSTLLTQCGSVIGVDENSLNLGTYKKLRVRPRGAWRPGFVSAGGLVESMRVIKDETEIAALKKSFNLNHAMLDWLEKRMPEISGLSEKKLAWEIERFFRENGAQELAFASIVASGSNSALPHAIPGDTLLASNLPLLVDVGCRVDNYCSDQTRTWFPGAEPENEFAKTLELVRAAQKAAMGIMRPGVACADVYAAARKVFVDAGVEKNFNHGLGHGVGLETHEKPSLSPRSLEVLRKGMVVTVEPGLYYGSWGGARWENTVLVTEDGISVF